MKPTWHNEHKLYSFPSRFFEVDGTKFELTGVKQEDGKVFDCVTNFETREHKYIERNKLGEILIGQLHKNG